MILSRSKLAGRDLAWSKLNERDLARSKLNEHDIVTKLTDSKCGAIEQAGRTFSCQLAAIYANAKKEINRTRYDHRKDLATDKLDETNG
jgi:hypothetical protein